MSNTATIDSMEEFLAHALALEYESVERYDELADVMEVHNNTELEELFRKLAGFGRLHAGEVESHAADMSLPEILPWEFKWSDVEAPETGDSGETHYLMTAMQALRFASKNEIAGRDFYQSVADTSASRQVRDLAAEFSAEESEHVAMLDDLISITEEDRPDWADDPDPPHMPE